MSLGTTSLGFLSKAAMAAASRFITPKDIVVDIGMKQELYVQKNLQKQNLKYHFSTRDKVIARTQDGWRIAIGRKWIVVTEQYVDKRKELVLMCKNI